MLYKMYKMTFKEPPEITEDLNYFSNLYKMHGVEIIGEWFNMDNHREMYFITKYEDKEHYQNFIDKAQNDPKYQEISKKLDELRESVEVINLEESGFA